jgi:hypothetical protein
MAASKPFKEIIREEEVILQGTTVTVRRKHFPQGNFYEKEPALV